MILFWVICALLIVIALAFVLPPALQRPEESNVESDDERKQANIAVYRDQLSELEADLRNGIVAEEQYAQDREEIERRLLEDTATTKAKKTSGAAPINARSTAYLLGIGLPLIAIVFYLRIGEPDRITNPAPVGAPPTAAAAAAAPPERTQEQIEANVAKLAQRLQSNPNDAQGWAMLARSYTSLEKYSEALNAYAKATELNPKDVNLAAEYAFVAGSAAFQAKDYKKAIDYWQRVRKIVPPGSEAAEAINARINEAKTLAASK